MDLPLALAALFLLLLLLAAPPATLFLALHLHRLRRRRRRREPRLTPSEPAAAELEPRAPAEEDEGAEEKRPRRRARRKQQQQEDKGGDATAAAGGGEDDDALLLQRPRFPLASVAGALQRRITARYDDLARASQDQCLTIDQKEEKVNLDLARAANFCHRGLHSKLSTTMEISVALTLLLVISIIPLLQLRHQQPHSSAPPQSSQPLTPLAGGSEKKRRKPRRKQNGLNGSDKAVAVQEIKGPEITCPPLSQLSGALKLRIAEKFEGFRDACLLSFDHSKFAAVREFLDCLVDARNDLLQKSENARRKLTIKKALLSNSRNCRSSYDELRLSKQADKLESEYERLSKDAAIYDYLEEQLRLSEPYKRMTEVHDAAEKEALEQALAAEEPEMTFEELLAEEKKDAAFWWPDGKRRSIK